MPRTNERRMKAKDLNDERGRAGKVRHIKLILGYDGTNFEGWQIQPKGRTVQGEVERSLEVLHKQKTPVLCAGRTDSGVHARGQVVSFFSPLDSIPVHLYPKALNSVLPKDIAVRSAELVSEEFHPRYDARKRTYFYYLDPRASRDISQDRYSWQLGRMPNVQRLNQYAQAIVGTHDFTTFSAVNPQMPNPVRTIFTSAFYPKGPLLVYEITGMSFLWRMVRSLVGSMVYYDQKNFPSDRMVDYLQRADRSLCGPTAPAQGLFLHHISYGTDHFPVAPGGMNNV